MTYQKPAFNTPEYWRAWKDGFISWEEAEADQASHDIRRKRAKDFYNKKAPAPNRHLRPPPVESKQWCKPMATTAARDNRLTPEAKSLLQVIAARTGRGRLTDTSKGTLADIMKRCPRSIQRYLAELAKFGYIRTQIKKSRRSGLYIGLRIWIMNTVLPYFTKRTERYDTSLYGHDWRETLGNPEETNLSLKKLNTQIFNIYGIKKPPWIDETILAF